jgi:pimeloyl-ACP methyl ester carboxylesterase
MAPILTRRRPPVTSSRPARGRALYAPQMVGSADTPPAPYDEFAYFKENADEFGIAWDGPPTVRRESVEVAPGRRLSALVWGAGEPELVLLHGGSQNAHTWDTVALALRRPLVAIDLPGHGHSDDLDADVQGGAPLLPAMATDVGIALGALAPHARGIVGMSMGGLTALTLCASDATAAPRVAFIDITPGVTPAKAAHIVAFVQGPETFATFDEILARTIEHNPTRSVESLRRGVLHNARHQEDGSWIWRHRRGPRPVVGRGVDNQALWEELGGLRIPVLLVRGMAKGSVVDDEDEAEFRRRLPEARVAHVEGAGHSVQGDRPVELASLLDEFIPRP